jgi:hypothetical protein
MQNNFKKTFKHSLTAIAVTVSLGLAIPALAAKTTGYIMGSSMSQNGTSLDSVTVNILNLETGLKRTIVSDENGSFRFPLLPPGKYDISAEKSGYQLVKEKKCSCWDSW